VASACHPVRAVRKILILGDSLSFGEGIYSKDRFDVKMLPSLPSTRVINTGTMGYGTDQEYMLSEIGNTFGIGRYRLDRAQSERLRRFIGRAKPYVEKVDGSYVLRRPPIGLWERWSDWCLVASVVARFIEPTDSESLDPSQSIEIMASSSVEFAKKCRAA